MLTVLCVIALMFSILFSAAFVFAMIRKLDNPLIIAVLWVIAVVSYAVIGWHLHF